MTNLNKIRERIKRYDVRLGSRNFMEYLDISEDQLCGDYCKYDEITPIIETLLSVVEMQSKSIEKTKDSLKWFMQDGDIDLIVAMIENDIPESRKQTDELLAKAGE